MRAFISCAAAVALLPALGALLTSCKDTTSGVPIPTCITRATVRRVTGPDSCRSFVLALADSSRTKLRPMGKLWQSFPAQDGKQVLIEYVTASADSTAAVAGCQTRVGKPVTITCIRPDSVSTK